MMNIKTNKAGWDVDLLVSELSRCMRPPAVDGPALKLWAVRALRVFQGDNGLVVDGWYGDKSYKVMNEVAKRPWFDSTAADPAMMRWVKRVSAAVDVIGGYQPLYIQWPFSDVVVLKRCDALRWVVGRLKDGRYSVGTCGHFATWLCCGLLGMTRARIGATGMACTGSWDRRENRWRREKIPKTLFTLALIDGARMVENLENGKVKKYLCDGVASLVDRADSGKTMAVLGRETLVAGDAGVWAIDLGSHVVSELVVPWHCPDIIDPRHGGGLAAGAYRLSSDGSKAKPRPVLFRGVTDKDPKIKVGFFFRAGTEVTDVDWTPVVVQK